MNNKELIKDLIKRDKARAKKIFVNGVMEQLEYIAKDKGMEYANIFHFTGNELNEHNKNVLELINDLPLFDYEIQEILDYLEIELTNDLEKLPETIIEEFYEMRKKELNI